MKKHTEENYLEKIPVKCDILYDTDEKGITTLQVENKGVMNKFAQLVFKKPKISYIHLDEFGSFVWNEIDGEKDVFLIGKSVKEHFGDKAEPLYERLSQYIETLKKYGFAEFK